MNSRRRRASWISECMSAHAYEGRISGRLGVRVLCPCLSADLARGMAPSPGTCTRRACGVSSDSPPTRRLSVYTAGHAYVHARALAHTSHLSLGWLGRRHAATSCSLSSACVVWERACVALPQVRRDSVMRYHSGLENRQKSPVCLHNLQGQKCL